jgi:hemoglobin-like flavoprotein
VESVNGWSAGCDIQAVTSDITVLETSIHHHQALYEGMCQAYTEVSRIHNHQALYEGMCQAYTEVSRIHNHQAVYEVMFQACTEVSVRLSQCHDILSY